MEANTNKRTEIDAANAAWELAAAAKLAAYTEALDAARAEKAAKAAKKTNDRRHTFYNDGFACDQDEACGSGY